jgi:hypothetical protein
MTTSDRFPSGPGRPGTTSPPGSTPGVTEKLQDAASRVTDTVQGAAAPVLDQAGERASQVADQVMDQATSRLDTGKEYAVDTLNGVAQALRQTGQHLREDGSQPTLGQYADTGAQQLERFTGYLRQRDTNQLLSEVESYARRNPIVFVSGAFALGLLAARFFRSSGQRSRSMMSGAPSGRFSSLTPAGHLTMAPVAQSTPARPPSSPPSGSQTPQADQHPPGPGSLSSQNASTSGAGGPPRGPGSPSSAGSTSRPSGSPSPRPESSTGGTTPSTDRPHPGSPPRV